MSTTREVELKALIDDEALRRARVEAAGATLVYEGRLEDRRFDTPGRALSLRDYVVRLRTWRGADGVRAALDWKGPTRYEDGYKVRDELTTTLGAPDALQAMLLNLGYIITREIDRHIVQYDLGGAMVRFERYPRMDVLVEVEGTPELIEAAIATIGLPREAFTTERLPDFVARFELRTGQEAALADIELAGQHPFRMEDA